MRLPTEPRNAVGVGAGQVTPRHVGGKENGTVELTRRYGLTFGYVTVALLAVGLLLALAGRGRATTDLGIAGVLAGCTAIPAAILSLLARRRARRAAALRSGDFLAHWTYAEEEWRPFLAAERERAARRSRWLPLWWALGATVWGMITFAILAGWPAILLCAAAGAVVGWLSARDLRATVPAGREAGNGVGEAFIGRDAALVNGTFEAWTGFGVALATVGLTAGRPSTLDLSVVSSGGQSTRERTVRIPVPAGRDAEAEQLIDGLLARAR